MNKDVVRRILAARYRPKQDSAEPSWLTVLGHAKDSLWSLDLFQCESAVLYTHWVLVVMDQFTRRIMGFGVHRGVVDGVALCRMFNRAIGGQSAPTYLSSDHDPLYRFHQSQANLRILEVEAITAGGPIAADCIRRQLRHNPREDAGSWASTDLPRRRPIESHARHRPRLKYGRGADSGLVESLHNDGLVQTSLRHDWQFAIDRKREWAWTPYC